MKLEQVVDEFIRRGGSVCPHARGSARIYAAVGQEPCKDRASIWPAVCSFAATKGKTPNGALLVSGPDLEGFAATRTWAREVFLELMVDFGLLDGLDARMIAAHVEEHIRPMLLDDSDPRRPVLGCRGAPLFSICMAPLYPKTHPRYAPRPVVVVTWHEDVGAAAGQEPAASRIRQAMIREHGCVYDADELMLPWPLERS
jgi:hypothetical protein